MKPSALALNAKIAKTRSDLLAGHDPGPDSFRLKPTGETYSPLQLTRHQPVVPIAGGLWPGHVGRDAFGNRR